MLKYLISNQLWILLGVNRILCSFTCYSHGRYNVMRKLNNVNCTALLISWVATVTCELPCCMHMCYLFLLPSLVVVN